MWVCDRPLGRPSEVNVAIKVLKAGLEKKHPLCSAVFNFPLGKSMLDCGQVLVERHAQDILGDASFKAACAYIEHCTMDHLIAIEELPVSEQIQDHVQLAGSKLLEAFGTWSQVRCEEKWEDCRELVTTMMHVIMHGAAAVVCSCVSTLKPMLDALDDGARVRGLGDPVAEGNVFQLLKGPLADVGRCSMSCKQVLQHVHSKVEKNIEYQRHLLDKLANLPYNGLDLLKQFARDAASDLLLLEAALTSSEAFLSGLEAMMLLLNKKPGEYPKLLDDYEAWMGKSPRNLCQFATLQARLEAGDLRNYLDAAGVWYSARRQVAVSPVFPNEHCVKILKSNMNSTAVRSTWQWIKNSKVANEMLKRLCCPVTEICIAGVVSDLNVMNFGTMDASSVKFDNHTLPLLVGGDLEALAAKSKEHLSFVSSVCSEVLPQVRRLRVLLTLLENTTETVSSDSLQHMSSGRQPIPKKDCEAILNVYSQMCTTACVAAVLQHFIVNQSVPLSRFSSATPSAKKAKQTDDKGVPVQEPFLGLDPAPINMIYTFQDSLAKLKELLMSDFLSGFDSKGHALKKPVSHCKQWQMCMGMYLKWVKDSYMDRASEELKIKAEELESCVPRWDVVFANDTLHAELAQTRILDQPKRALVKPLVRYVGSVNNDLNQHAKAWQVDNRIGEGMSNFVKAAVDTGNAYLVIAAGVNTVLHLKNAGTGHVSAEQVLKLASKSSLNMKMPVPLQTALEEMAAGVPQHAKANVLKAAVVSNDPKVMVKEEAQKQVKASIPEENADEPMLMQSRGESRGSASSSRPNTSSPTAAPVKVKTEPGETPSLGKPKPSLPGPGQGQRSAKRRKR